MAAAEGIRQTVRAKHGRWKREATVTCYDGLAPGEENEVSKALQRRLARAWKEAGSRVKEGAVSRKRRKRAAEAACGARERARESEQDTNASGAPSKKAP